jgi:hypothetical protein
MAQQDPNQALPNGTPTNSSVSPRWIPLSAATRVTMTPSTDGSMPKRSRSVDVSRRARG